MSASSFRVDALQDIDIEDRHANRTELRGIFVFGRIGQRDGRRQAEARQRQHES